MELQPRKKIKFDRRRAHSDDILYKTKTHTIITNVAEEKGKISSNKPHRKTTINNIKDNIAPLIMLILFCILAPSWDVYSDLQITIDLFRYGHPRYAAAMILPLLLNFIFTFFMWQKMERKEAKRWSWVLVVAQCWPQFFAARIVLMIING